MASTPTNAPSKALTRLQLFLAGLTASSLAALNTIIVLGTSMTKAEIMAKLQSFIALYTAVNTTKQAYASAVAARKAATAAINAFYVALVAAVKVIVGPNNPSLLASFGIPLPKARKEASPETKAISKAKSQATRAARGTMSAKKRQTITATPAPSVQIVGLPGSNPASATPAVPASAPSSSASAPSSSASAPSSSASTPSSSASAPSSSASTPSGSASTPNASSGGGSSAS